MTSKAGARTRAVVIPLHTPRGQPLAAGMVAPLAERVSAISFDEARPAPETARLRAELDGRALGRKVVSTALPLRHGGRRRVLLAALPAQVVAASRVTLFLGGEPAAAIDPEWLESPLADSVALTEGLSDEGRRRLLALLVTTGASLFGADATPGFAALVDRLFDQLGLAPLAAAAWRPVGCAGRLVSYRAAAGLDPDQIGPLTALAGGRFTRLRGCRIEVERAPRGDLLHVHLPQLRAGAMLIGCGGAPIRLLAPDAAVPGRPLSPWLARRAPATRAWVHGLLVGIAGADETAAAQLAEIEAGDDAAPRIAIRHLSSTATGLLYALRMEDRHGLVRGIRIERDGAVADIPVATSARPVRDVAGFVEIARPAPFGQDRVRLRLIHGSGRLRTAAEAAPAPFPGDVPAAFDLADRAVVGALAAARLSTPRRARPADLAAFGPDLAEPALSVIAAIGKDVDVIAARAAMLAGEPGAGEVEIVCHVEAGRLADAAQAAAARAAAVFGVAHRVVIVAPGGDAADRLLAALACARGASLLLLGAAVLPAAPGWLAPWRGLAASGRPILGATLVDWSGAVIDAGGERFDDRRHEGLPAADLPAVIELAAARLCGDCVGLTRDAAARLAAEADRYPNPEVMLAETAARLAGEGHEIATRLDLRFVRYAEAPAADRRTECVDVEALDRILKRSFRPVAQGERP